MQAALVQDHHGSPLLHELPAAACEALDARAAVSLRMLSPVPVRLTPQRIASMPQEQVNKLLHTYRLKLGARLLALQTVPHPDSADQNIIQVLQLNLLGFLVI